MIDDEVIPVDGLKVAPDEVDSEGFWRSKEDPFSCDIRHLTFPVPEEVGEDYQSQSVLAVLPAKNIYRRCPNCKEGIGGNDLILVLEEFHIYVGKCCGRMVWLENDGQRWEEKMT